MHILRISAQYPRPKFPVCDLVVFEVEGKTFKIGLIVGISWSVASQQWSYEIQQSGSLDEDSVSWLSEDEIMPIASFLEDFQASQRSILVGQLTW